MGVQGLLKFLRTNPKTRVQNISLADLAKKKRKESGKRAKIVCDFLSVMLWLLKLFHEAKITEGSYKKDSYLFGGGYVEYSNRFIALLRALQCHAEPILFVDGSRGSSLDDLEIKMLTLESREYERLKFVEKCVRYCDYDPTLDPEDVRKWRKYPLIIMHVLMAVRKEVPDVEILHCESEADSEMADYTRMHPEVCGILSTDTDMVMMRRCTLIHCKFFDREDILGLRRPIFNEMPPDVICDLITPRSLAQALEIEVENLKIISIICGNDYTRSYKIYRQMNLGYPFIRHAAKWLANYPSVSQHFFEIPMFQGILLQSPEFFDAVKHTYEAYGEAESFVEMCKTTNVVRGDIQRHPKVPSRALSRSPVVDMVRRGINDGRISRKLSSVACSGIFWRNKHVEGQTSSTQTFVCAYDLTFLLRRVIYMLLGLTKVREYGNFTKSISVAVRFQDFTFTCDSSSLLLEIRGMQALLSRVLHLIPFIVKAKSILHLRRLPFGSANIPAGYNPHVASQLKPVLLCASLLHACSLKDDSSTFENVEVVKDVFLATCLMSVYENPPLEAFERPTVESMNMNAGFACIIQHVYEIASLFDMLDVLSPPGCCYQPAALVAFHQVAIAGEERVKRKRITDKHFVSLHTTYTHLIQLRKFLELKKILQEFQQKCENNQLDVMDLVRLAKAFYDVLGQYHTSAADLDGKIEELQAKVITQQPSSKTKGETKSLLNIDLYIMNICFYRKVQNIKEKKIRASGF